MINQVGFGYRTSYDAIRFPLYKKDSDSIGFIDNFYSKKEYILKLNPDQIKKMNGKVELTVILTNQTPAQIIDNGIKINPKFVWKN